MRGFSRDDATPLTGDSLNHTAAWIESELESLPPGKYLIRLHLDRAEVYALTLNQ